MSGIELVLFILVIGLIGWVSSFLFFHDMQTEETGWLERCMVLFLAGFAITSVTLLGAVFTGNFHEEVVLAAAGILLLLFLLKKRRHPTLQLPIRLSLYLMFCLSVGLVSLALAKRTRPYEAIICGNDASVYIASAFDLVDSGSLHSEDRVVMDLTREEREMFHSEREESYIRFRAGVHLVDPDRGIVGFSFFPLFPVWLALGLLTLGPYDFLNLLSFFSVLGMILFYLIGKRASGRLIGFLLTGTLFFFYPQFYFSRMPWSEILSQTLFFSGLWIFTSGDSIGHQRLSAILWGTIFLCRIDMPFFLILSLLLIFCLHPDYSTRWRVWRPFILGIFLFLFCTFYWQLNTGSYLRVWGLNKQVVARVMWLPVVSYCTQMLTLHPVIGTAIFFILAAGILVSIHFLLGRHNDEKHARLKAIAGLVLTAGILLSLIGTHLQWQRVLVYTSRALVYIEPFLVVALVLGLGLFLYTQVKGSKSKIHWILFAFFILPAVFYLTRPLIVPQQPLFVRRFVPVVFPLFFLLAVTGWRRILLKLISNTAIATLVLSILMLTMAGSFFLQTRYLVERPLFADVIWQVDRMIRRFPEDALVIVPRADEGIYIEMPLQYMAKRDTISMPEPQQQYRFDSFVKRQLDQNRSVFVLSLASANSASELLYQFRLKREFIDRLSFLIVPPVEAGKFPARIQKAVLQYQADRVLPRGLSATKDDISYNDTDVSFINFNVAEAGFRWTKDKSEIRNFTFETRSRNVDLVLTMDPLSEGLDLSGLKVLINGNVPARLTNREASHFHFLIPGGDLSQITSVLIQTKSFVPRQLGINNDPRTLGIPFVRLRLIRE